MTHHDTQARESSLFVFKLLAFLTESSVFLYLGLSVFGLGYMNHYHATLITSALVMCVVSRAAHVYPISYVVNRLAERSGSSNALGGNGGNALGSSSARGSPRGGAAAAATARLVGARPGEERIPPRTQHMLWFSGLRGAVAFACAVNFPDHNGP